MKSVLENLSRVSDQNHHSLTWGTSLLGGSLPVAGIRCFCYSGFDNILGEPASVALLAHDENALELAVYNWTRDTFCGIHYDAVSGATLAVKQL